MPSAPAPRRTSTRPKAKASRSSSSAAAAASSPLPSVVPVSSALRRRVTVARRFALSLNELAQRREHARVQGLCKVRAHQVLRLARALGISLPAAARSAEGPRNVCHALGAALSGLFVRGRGPAGRRGTYAYPVRVAGSGVAGLVFCMSDGTAVKVVALRGNAGSVLGEGRGGSSSRRRRPASAPTAGVASSGRPVPLREFLYEVRATRRAHARFDSARAGAFRVPRVLRYALLRGTRGKLLGVMQTTWAAGRTLHATLRDVPHSVALGLAARHGRALAALHERGWAHGDMHSSNIIVSRARNQGADAAAFTVLDWARSNTRRAVLAAHPAGRDAARALWRRFLRYEVTHPYRDYMRSASRAVAEAYLDGYLKRSGAAAGRGAFGGAEPVVDLRLVRHDWDGYFNRNVQAMFRALDMVAAKAVRRAA